MACHKFFNFEKCNRVIPFNSRSSHLTKCHSEKEILKCSECEYQTNVKGNLTRHMKSHETKEKEKVRFQCPHCKKIFLQNRNLTRHMKNHLVESGVNCNICDKKLQNIYNLNSHMSVMHQEFFLQMVQGLGCSFRMIVNKFNNTLVQCP